MSQRYDLIVTGADCPDGGRGLGDFVAGGLRRRSYLRNRLDVAPDGAGLDQIEFPAVISISAVGRQPEGSMIQTVDAFFSDIQVLKHHARPGRIASAEFALPAVQEVKTERMTEVRQAATYLRSYASSAHVPAAPDYTGEIAPGALADGMAVWAILDPGESKSNLVVLEAACIAARLSSRSVHAVIPAPRSTFPQLAGFAHAHGAAQAFCVDTKDGRLADDGQCGLLRAILKASGPALIVAGGAWYPPFAYVAGEHYAAREEPILLCSGVTALSQDPKGPLTFSLPVYDAMLVRRCSWQAGSAFVTVAPEADFPAPSPETLRQSPGSRLLPEFKAVLVDFPVSPGWIAPLPPVAPPTLAQAEVIVDLGYGIRDRDGLDLAGELKRVLEEMGLSPMFGATRKVTQDLKLLALDSQIGQTGVRVNPRLVIAVGISGAPQHIDYIGPRAEILCFNKDPDAPLMKLNETRPSPRVHPIAGDLFVTVRNLVSELKR